MSQDTIPYNYLVMLADLLALFVCSAVVVALAAWFVLWLAQKAVRKWATWMRVEQEDERCTKEDTYSVEEKKK